MTVARRALLRDNESEERFPPGWYVIAESRELPRGRPIRLQRFGRPLVLWRTSQGAIGCLDDRCTHRGASLSLGTLKGDCVACPFHGFEFDARGSCTRLPVLGPEGVIPKALDTRAFVVREQDDWLWLWWGEPRDELPKIPRFEHLHTGRHRWHTIAREWDASFVRVIENQLDPFHLPFVHKRTIGRSMPERMTVHHVEDEQRITAWSGAERTNPHDGFYIEFLWANLWENHIAERFSIVAAFAPIDAQRTRTYLRTYQAFVTVPVLRWFFDRVLALSNSKVFSEDQRVVVSQPQAPLLAEGEVLVKADRAIIAYRKMFERYEREGMR
jgi:phenylpropionate dioxygenase-like ring-hydroxylating dioxygenase large terminal subunit